MKILFKSIGTGILCFVAFILLIALADNIPTMISNVFEVSLRDWWYDFVAEKTLEYAAATAVLTAVMYLVWQWGSRAGRSAGTVLAVLAAGELILTASFGLYWNYIEENCIPAEWSGLEMAYTASFGSLQAARLYFFIFVCVIFAAGIILKYLKVFFRDRIKKETADQVFSGNRLFHEILCTGIPLCIILTGNYSMVVFFGFPAAEYFSAVFVAMILWHVLVPSFYFRKMLRYYRSIIEDREIERYFVIVRENSSSQKSFLYEKIWRKENYIEKLKKQEIYVLPRDLAEGYDGSCIMLDVYAREVEKELKDKEKFEKTRLQERGTFNIAYCEDRQAFRNYIRFYDRYASDMEILIKEIIELKGFLQYRERQTGIISKLQTDRLTVTNCIVDEVIAFRRYFDRNINRFLVFDYAIKWLETVNYLYTIIAVSHQAVPLSGKVRNRIVMADFKKWTELRENVVHDRDIDGIISRSHRGDSVFQSFQRIWKAVTVREYSFSKYTVGELIAASNRLRNYTRGHGVFTFEISDEINLDLLEILVFLINQLIVNDQLEGEFSNLEGLGWMVYVGDTPYFLYSYNKTYDEYCFNSFRNSSSIMLPADIRSGEDEQIH